jgi:hypothetical protein
VVFGLLGRHPIAAYAVQVALVASAAVLLRSVLARFVDARVALATAALWLVVPNHGSLLHWTTASAITVALILLLAGIGLVADGRVVAGAIVLGVSVLTYEATAPAAAVAMVVVPRLQGRDWRRPLAAGVAILAPVGAWVVANLPPVKEGLGQSADLGLVLPAHAGWGVFPDGPAATFGGAAFCVLVVLLAVDAVRRRALEPPTALVVAGLVTIVLGTLPFVRYFYSPLGAGDRVNVVAGVGTAMAWAGLGWWLARRAPVPAVAATATAVVAAMGVAAWSGSTAWADAVDDGERVLAAIPDHPGSTRVEVTIQRPAVRRNVAAFADPSNIDSAVQLQTGSRSARGRFRPDR